MRGINKILGSINGQAVVIEYLMLLVLAFVVAFFVIRGPIANFSISMLETIRVNIGNLVRTAELTQGPELTAGERGHPSNPSRFKPLHL